MRAGFKRTYLFHTLFWFMLAVLVLMQMQYYIYKEGWVFVGGPLATSLGLMAILVYTNTLFLLPQLLEKKRTILYIVCVVALIACYTYLRSVAQKYWDLVAWPDEPMELYQYMHVNVIYAMGLILTSTLLYFSQKWNEQRQQVKNIQINQLQTELKYLRSQVNPHFLFNGLNTIYGNIDMKDQKARDILLQFADLLRYNLYEADVDLVDLEKEAVYLENYVALQRARSNENMQIELNVQIENKDLKIAPLLFIPFIENAFKFSTRDDSRPNNIRISLQQSGKRIQFTCSNTFENHSQDTGGIGLSNVKRRLELLYKDRYTLEIKKEEPDYTVNLTVMV